MRSLRIEFGVMAILLVSMAVTLTSAQDATYQLTFGGNWGSDLPRPGGAHFSPLIGATHQAPGAILTVGELDLEVLKMSPN